MHSWTRSRISGIPTVRRFSASPSLVLTVEDMKWTPHFHRYVFGFLHNLVYGLVKLVWICLVIGWGREKRKDLSLIFASGLGCSVKTTWTRQSSLSSLYTFYGWFSRLLTRENWKFSTLPYVLFSQPQYVHYPKNGGLKFQNSESYSEEHQYVHMKR